MSTSKRLDIKQIMRRALTFQQLKEWFMDQPIKSDSELESIWTEAIFAQQTEFVEWLQISNISGANAPIVNIAIEYGINMLHVIKESSCYNSLTLAYAIEKNQQEIIEYLLAFDPTAFDFDEALLKAIETDNNSIARRILEGGYCNDLHCEVLGKHIAIAVQNSNYEIIQLLCEHTDFDTNVAILIAAEDNNLEAIKILYKDKNASDYGDLHALLEAAKQDFAEIVQFFCPLVSTRCCKTALFKAIKHGSIRSVQILMQKPTLDQEVFRMALECANRPDVLASRRIDRNNGKEVLDCLQNWVKQLKI